MSEFIYPTEAWDYGRPKHLFYGVMPGRAGGSCIYYGRCVKEDLDNEVVYRFWDGCFDGVEPTYFAYVQAPEGAK